MLYDAQLFVALRAQPWACPAGNQELQLRTVEVSRAKGSPLALLTGGGGALTQLQGLLQASLLPSLVSFLGTPDMVVHTLLCEYGEASCNCVAREWNPLLQSLAPVEWVMRFPKITLDADAISAGLCVRRSCRPASDHPPRCSARLCFGSLSILCISVTGDMKHERLHVQSRCSAT